MPEEPLSASINRELAAKIAAAFVRRNQIGSDQLGPLISTVHQALARDLCSTGCDTEVLDLIDRTAAAAWIAQIERTAGGAVALTEPMPGAVHLNRLAVEPDPHRAHLSCLVNRS